MGALHLGHLSSLLLGAVVISLAFACLSQATPKQRLFLSLRYFAYLLVISLLLGWLMYPFSH